MKIGVASSATKLTFFCSELVVTAFNYVAIKFDFGKMLRVAIHRTWLRLKFLDTVDYVGHLVTYESPDYDFGHLITGPPPWEAIISQ